MGPTEQERNRSSWMKKLGWVSVCILIIAASMRLLGLDKSLWIDEASSLAQARAVDFIQSARTYDHPPAYFALLRLGFEITDSYTVLRLGSVLFGLSVIVAALLFFGDRFKGAGNLAAFFLALSPGFVVNSQELRQYALLSALLMVAMLFTHKIWESNDRSAHYWVAVTLTCAAATHLVTVFFSISMLIVTLYGMKSWSLPSVKRVAYTFIPSVIVALYFKFSFLEQTAKTAANWWMPPVSPHLMYTAFADITGWSVLMAHAKTLNSALNYSGWLFALCSICGIVFCIVVAWLKRPATAAHRLLAIGLIYWALVILYSIFITPIVWPRTLLLGMLPCVLGISFGIMTHSKRRERQVAIFSLCSIIILIALPWVSGKALLPKEDLRSLVASTEKRAQPSDFLIFINGIDIGFAPYWPSYKHLSHININLSRPDSNANTLWEALKSKHNTVFLIYREDLYLAKQREDFNELRRRLALQFPDSQKILSDGRYEVVRYDRR